MKRVSKFLIVLVLFVLGVYATVYTMNKVYSSKLDNAYYDKMGDKLLTEKNQGIALQEESLKREDNFQLFGSSELSGVGIPSHPIHTFDNKASGYQINMIGRGYSQSLIHTINIGALSKELNGKKLAIIISPQWFTEEGLGKELFPMNFSELQFYEFMFNKSIDKSFKLELSKRVAKLTEGNDAFKVANQYARDYLKNDLKSNVKVAFFSPYYKLRSYILGIKDKKDSLKVISEQKDKVSDIKPASTIFNWNEELKKAGEIGKTQANNNNFAIENGYYTQYVKDNLNKTKGIAKGQSYLKSPEYGDLELLLKLCKSENIDPLFVSVPVHGKWYDYIEFSKENRAAYYQKVDNLITSYGFKVADLSKYEYEDYFLKDIMHLGWKGWVYVDQAIDEYYHSGR